MSRLEKELNQVGNISFRDSIAGFCDGLINDPRTQQIEGIFKEQLAVGQSFVEGLIYDPRVQEVERIAQEQLGVATEITNIVTEKLDETAEALPWAIRTLNHEAIQAINHSPETALKLAVGTIETGYNLVKHPGRTSIGLATLLAGTMGGAPVSAQNIQEALVNSPAPRISIYGPGGERVKPGRYVVNEEIMQVAPETNPQPETTPQPQTVSFFNAEGNLVSQETTLTDQELPIKHNMSRPHRWAYFQEKLGDLSSQKAKIGETVETTFEFVTGQPGEPGQPGSNIRIAYNNPPASFLRLLGYYVKGMENVRITYEGNSTIIEATWGNNPTCVVAPIYNTERTGSYSWSFVRTVDSNNTFARTVPLEVVDNLNENNSTVYDLNVTPKTTIFPVSIVQSDLATCPIIPYKVKIGGRVFESASEGQIELPRDLTGIQHIEFILPDNFVLSGLYQSDMRDIHFSLNRQLRIPEGEVVISPESLCAGWNVYPSFEGRNDLGIDLHDVRIVASRPETCNNIVLDSIRGLVGGTVPIEAVVNEQAGTVTWNVGTLEKNAAFDFDGGFHTASNLPVGTVVEVTYTIYADELDRPITITEKDRVTVQGCAPSPSPSPSRTSTEEPSRTATIEPSATVRPSATATIEPSVTVRPSATATIEPSVTVRPSETATIEPSATVRPSATATIEPSVTVRPSETATIEPSATATEVPTTPPVTPDPSEEPHRVYIPVVSR